MKIASSHSPCPDNLFTYSTATDAELSAGNSQNFPRLDPFQFEWEDDEDCCDCCPCTNSLPSPENVNDPKRYPLTDICRVHEKENVYHSCLKMRPKGLHVFTDGRSTRNPRNAKNPYRSMIQTKPTYIQAMREKYSQRFKKALKSVCSTRFHKLIDCTVGVIIGGKHLFKFNMNRLIVFAQTIMGKSVKPEETKNDR